MHHRTAATVLGLAAPAVLVGLVGLVGLASCSSSTKVGVVADEAGGPVTTPTEEAGAKDAYVAPVPEDAGPDPLLGCTKDPGAPAVAVDPSSATDPAGGADKFTLAKALDGYPAGTGKLYAGIRTENGAIKCELFEATAPLSVANFVGLARGTRPYKDDKGKWKLGHFYDGLTWHRVIPNFVIQGGDPGGDGTGGPGYDLVKENQIAEPLGALAQAAAKNPSGSQFYIVVGKGPAADYNVFGSCETETAVAIASVPVDSADAPKTPVHMIKVEIARCP
jgi:peptidyl-prolyl cis-trans isomerase A (cyclophilin A)